MPGVERLYQWATLALRMTDTSQVDSQRTPARPKKGGSAWPLYAIFLALIGSGVFVCVASTRLKGIADDYLELVREGRLEAAYEMTAPTVRATIDLPAFSTSAENTRLRKAGEASWNYSGAGSNGQACTEGSIRIDGESIGIRVFLVDTEAGWRTHTVQLYDAMIPRGPWSCNSR